MGIQRLVEAVSAPEQIIKENLPKGILSRVRRTICEIGKRNANKRVYEKEVWDKVLNDPEFKKKLENRQILGSMEHPAESQLKLDQNISHVVSSVFINEAEDAVKADFDILPTEAGKFIEVLLEAGVKVGASTRADGELEEKIDEASGDRYSRVIPESYMFITIDHTADPSCGMTEPENIIKAVKENYAAHKINKNVAMALLETIHTAEAKNLEEKIKIDKQHAGCKCNIMDKKCNGGCGHNKTTLLPTTFVKEMVIKAGSVISDLLPLAENAEYLECLTSEINEAKKKSKEPLFSVFSIDENFNGLFLGVGTQEQVNEIVGTRKFRYVVPATETIDLSETIEAGETLKGVIKDIPSETKPPKVAKELNDMVNKLAESRKGEVISGIEDLMWLKKLELTEKQIKLVNKLLENKQ